MVDTRAGRNPVKTWSVAAALTVVLAMLGALMALPASADPVANGTFAGTVTLPDGTPAAGVTVELRDEWYLPPKATTTTAPDGTYEVDAPPGGYTIRFVEPSGDYLWSLHQGSAGAYNEFYGAPPTELVGGETVTVDHALIRSGSIRGKLTLPADVLPSEVTVIAYHPRPLMGMAPRTHAQISEVAADGSYVIPLREGNYVVEIAHSGGLLRGDLSIPARVKGLDITRIDVAPQRTASISGVVRVPAGSEGENVRITPYTLQMDSEGNQMWQSGESIVAKAGEPYLLPGLGRGYYRLEFAPESSNSKLAPSYWPRASSVDQGEDIALLDGSARDGYDGELAVGGEVTGRVDLALGLTPGDASVELWRQVTIVGGSTSWQATGFAQQIAADGSFRISGVAAGTYRLKAGDVDTEVFHPAATTVEAGADFEVTLGGTTTGIDVRVPRVPPTPTPVPEPILKTLERLKAPKVTGTAKVGRTLKVSKGTWKPKSVTVKYRWYVKKGKKAVKVKAATKSKLKLKKSTRGKKYRVVVTVSKNGYKTVKFTSKWSKKVKK